MTSAAQDDLFDAVVTILALAVLIDGHERDRELIEFSHACCVHNRKIRDSVIMPKDALDALFWCRREAITDALASDDPHAYKAGLLARITDPDLRLTVLSSVFTIFIADGEFHPEESAFLSFMLDAWDLTSMPAPEQVEAVACR